jgi:formylglycine-generating enzyme required for sulfatase activity
MTGAAGRGTSWTFETVIVDARGEVIARTSHQADGMAEALGDGVVLEMVSLPGGSYQMGSRSGQGYDDEHPLHFVRAPAFLMGRFTVTQEQWAAVMPSAPPYRCAGPRRPVDRVTWDAAREFCRRLAYRTGRDYRLPSEAEWEYACRAGSTTPFHFGPTLTTDLANYVGEHVFSAEPPGVYRHCSTDVGSFLPNEFGLYEMHGNMWEWCQDAWHDDYTGAPVDGRSWEQRGARRHVLRGGSWHEPPGNCRSAIRLGLDAGDGDDCVGFRIALNAVHLDHGLMPDSGSSVTRT